MEKTIRTLAELQTLRNPRGVRGIRSVRIELPGSPERVRQLEREINRHLRACGCGLGAVLVAAGLVALVVVRPAALLGTWPSMGSLLATAGLLAGLALAGKLAGLGWARWRLRLAIGRLENEALSTAASAAAVT